MGFFVQSVGCVSTMYVATRSNADGYYLLIDLSISSSVSFGNEGSINECMSLRLRSFKLLDELVFCMPQSEPIPKSRIFLMDVLPFLSKARINH